MTRKWATALALLGALLGWSTAPVVAGGGRLAPVQERYEPGQTASVVGYTGGPAPDLPFYAYLRPADEGSTARLLRTDIYVGELVVEETPHGGYQHLRVSLSFDLPDWLPAGDYELRYCDDPCTGALLGDLVPSPLSVGVDPVRRVVREWAPDEPEIADLAPDALVVGPGFQATASEMRAERAGPSPPPAPATTVPEVARVAPPAAPPVVPDDEMAWPLPSALVLASAVGTGLVLRRRPWSADPRSPTPRGPQVVPGGRSPGAASAGRG